MNVRPAICIVQDDRLLTMRYSYGGVDVFNLPGGNLEFGEKMTECLKRELQEELTIDVVVGELICLADVFIAQQKKQTLHAIFLGEVSGGEPTLNPSETSALAVEWLPVASLTHVHLYPSIAADLQRAIRKELPNPFVGRVEQPWTG